MGLGLPSGFQRQLFGRPHYRPETGTFDTLRAITSVSACSNAGWCDGLRFITSLQPEKQQLAVLHRPRRPHTGAVTVVFEARPKVN
jgi:hypothetical protein